ncbi:YadA-like family protein [[Pasteurella] aerogenes]
MNHIFKIKRNSAGQSVVTSELAKNKGKVASMASILLSSLVATSAIATPVSIQGTATNENAVSIGSDSFATAVDGVATGKSSVATGQGFSRDDFAVKVAENKAAVDAVNGKQDELNNANNQLDAANNAIGDLTKQIDDLTKQQEAIADKIQQRDALLPTQKDAQDKVNAATDTLNDAKTALDNISTNGKNLYLNFTDVLQSLDWSPLTSGNSDAGRTTIANELKSKIESNFSDFANKYTVQDYRDIVDGYINRQASYQGSAEGIANMLSSDLNINSAYVTRIFNNLKKDTNEYAETPVNNANNIGLFGASSTFNSINLSFGSNINSGSFLSFSGKTSLQHDDAQSFANRAILGNALYQNVDSKNYTLKYNSRYLFPDQTKDFTLLNNQSFKSLYDSVNTNSGILFVETDYFGVRTSNNTVTTPHFGDPSVPILSKLADYELDPINFLSSSDINAFRKNYTALKNHINSILWDDPNQAIDMVDYRSKVDKVLAYNEKINSIVSIYENIITESAKANSDSNVIDKLTKQLMDLKSEVLNDAQDLSNFGASLTAIRSSKAEEYINNAKPLADSIVSRINNELKLYNPDDEIIVEATTQAKELQDAYDDAKKKLEADQAKLDEINDKLNDLELTDTEKATDDVKKAKEDEKAAAEAEKERLEDEIKKGTEELDKLKEELANTSLKDLGLRSQAHGSNAFASGDDSIAMGTNATVTSNDGIAIGRDTNVTGKQSIAIGAENTVTGDKSIAIGVGHTVSGNRSSTIGDPNVISGDDVFVAGNNNNVASNNVMVMGNNITVGTGFDGTVVLGANSTVAAANPTSSIEIQGKTYNFAGTNPTSTVSVGKAGEERQITNVAAGRISETSTDAINGSQLYSVVSAVNAIKTTIDTVSDTNTQATVSADKGITITETDNANGTKNYAASAKLGDGLSFDENGAIRANGTTLHAGENVEITGDANSGYTISSKTQIINGGKATVVHAGDNVEITGDANSGYTISVENMRTTVTGGQGAEVTSSDNTDGSKNYTVNVKVGEGLTYDDKGNVVNDMKLTAGENVQVSGDAKGGYTISATDTNTQATVSADKGITITETNNANGTKNYAVSAKLGKGLKVDENGAIAANVAGVTTTTDDGKSYTRSDLTKPVGVKGDGKNISTSTANNGDVQVKLDDDIQVNSVSIHNGPTINQQGINAANTRITNVQDGVAPTDAVNVRQLNQQGNILNQRIDNLADNVKKNKKRNDAGIASTAAMANIPQVMLAGKSGVGVGVGHRSGQSAIAVGYSRASDNAKHIIKLSAGLDTQSKATFGAGYMYQW